LAHWSAGSAGSVVVSGSNKKKQKPRVKVTLVSLNLIARYTNAAPRFQKQMTVNPLPSARQSSRNSHCFGAEKDWGGYTSVSCPPPTNKEVIQLKASSQPKVPN